MDKSLEGILDSLKKLIDFDMTRRFFFLVGIAMSVVVGLTMYQWTQEPIYSPLDYQVSEQNVPAIIDALTKAEISYKLNDANGHISVPAKDLSMARMKLSAAGIQKDDAFSYAFLNDKNKLGSSQFLENARYLRALESDLAKTIGAIQGVNSAKVHIAKPQNNIFADEHAKTTASVILSIRPGYESDKEKIRAIVQLIAASVPDLDPNNVAITDQYGHYLSSMISPDSILNQEQLSYQNNIQSYYEKRINSLLLPFLGENKASINVNANIDFTKLEEAKEEFNPDEKTLRSEQSVTENSSSSAGVGVPGSLSNQPPTNTPAQGAGAGGQSRNESVKNYEVSKSMRYVHNGVPQIKSLSVAVVVDNEKVFDPKTKKTVSQPLSKDKISQITDLVKSSVGFNEKRGDQVTVINSSFIENKVEEIEPLKMWQQPWFWDMVKKSSGIVLGFVFLLVLYKKLVPELMGGKVKAEVSENALLGPNQPLTPEMIKLKNKQLDILRELVAQDPNKVAGVIKKWVVK